MLTGVLYIPKFTLNEVMVGDVLTGWGWGSEDFFEHDKNIFTTDINRIIPMILQL
jgi:hypothetical protein